MVLDSLPANRGNVPGGTLGGCTRTGRERGSLTSSNVTEPWIGAFCNDGKSLRGVGSSGQVQGRILDANNMEVVYTQIGSHLITSHSVFSRN